MNVQRSVCTKHVPVSELFLIKCSFFLESKAKDRLNIEAADIGSGKRETRKVFSADWLSVTGRKN